MAAEPLTQLLRLREQEERRLAAELLALRRDLAGSRRQLQELDHLLRSYLEDAADPALTAARQRAERLKFAERIATLAAGQQQHCAGLESEWQRRLTRWQMALRKVRALATVIDRRAETALITTRRRERRQLAELWRPPAGAGLD
jgi:flagellar export protein FliJ